MFRTVRRALVTIGMALTMVLGVTTPANATAQSIYNSSLSPMPGGVVKFEMGNGSWNYVWPGDVWYGTVRRVWVPSTRYYQIRKAGSTSWYWYCGSGWVNAALPMSDGRVSVRVMAGTCA